MIRTFAAALFALLAVTAPAHAAYITQIDTLDLLYPNNTTLTGELFVSPCCGGQGTFHNISLSLDGQSAIFATGFEDYLYTIFPSGEGNLSFITPPSYIPGTEILYLSPSNIFLNGTPPISGTVTISTETYCSYLGYDCTTLSATPVPPALPLFASALLALAGFAAYRARRTQRG
jgi:hypothetical protein